jgi:4-amino-4-deoxy-L-arabinose transferase-like glycosyltransferase
VRRPDPRLLAVLALAAGLVASFLAVHWDENDGAVYAVIARHLAADGTPLRLRYMPWYLTPFHEHPPLWIWVQGAVAWLAPGLHLGVLGLACALVTVGCAFVLGRHLFGARAAFLGTFLLATNDSFFRWSASAKLDPPLLALFTASVTLLVLARGRAAWLAAGGLAAGLGVLVKGAPALGAPVAALALAAGTGQREVLRSPRAWVLTAAAVLLPVVVFLAVDRMAVGGAWWNGYVHGQLLPSLDGRRADPRGHLYLLTTVYGRAIPLWPLALLALWRPAGARLALLAWAALVLGAFSAASRAYWWYALPAYVPLALLAGAALDDLVERFGGAWLTDRWLPRLAGATGVAGLCLLPLGLARIDTKPCRFGPLATEAARLAPAAAPLGLVSDPTDVPGMALVAEHTGHDVVIVDTVAGLPPNVTVALVRDLPAAPGWSERGRHEHYRLLTRAPAPVGAATSSSTP